jgi:hypothetical protein
VYLNVLVDWNGDADWNDNVLCRETDQCAPEWAVKNFLLTLNPGCGGYVSPRFQVGPRAGEAWMRVTVSRDPAPDDFPWNGTKGIGATQAFTGGETEDYPVLISPELVGIPERPSSGLWMAPPVPNPSPTITTLRFSLPSEERVTMEAFDMAGRRVRTFERGVLSPGEYVVSWDFRDDSGRVLPAGIYIVRLAVGGQTFTQRVVRLR